MVQNAELSLVRSKYPVLLNFTILKGSYFHSFLFFVPSSCVFCGHCTSRCTKLLLCSLVSAPITLRRTSGIHRYGINFLGEVSLTSPELISDRSLISPTPQMRNLLLTMIYTFDLVLVLMGPRPSPHER